MPVSHLEVTHRRPLAFDYERVDGRLHFAVDPAHPANARIADLKRAARDADGKVRFWADFVLLQPADSERGNRRLLYYVVNRGQRTGVPFNRFAPRLPTLPPSDEIDLGDGFLMKRGWTVAMCGWQWDVERQPGVMGLEAPQAVGEDGHPLPGRIAIAFQPNAAHSYHRLSHWPLHPATGEQALAHQPYPAADVNEPTAEMTVREAVAGPRTVIPRGLWRFAREEHGGPVGDDSHVWLEGGFLPGHWYEVTYTTRICPVVGTGLLATRDCVAWLRHDVSTDNPAVGRIDFAYGNGRSQCGRFLRQFLYEGLNVDESGQQVFDGLIPHVAGARRGEFNQRYGQPSETNPRGFGGLFPFTSDEVTDPVTGQTDGLLRRQRQVGGVPKIFTTNTASEYWRVDCSLIHTDPDGTRDVEPPPEERIYVVAGHQHGSGMAMLNDTTPIGARGANSFNMVDAIPVERGFLINLDRWVSEGIDPPPSAFPRLAEGTAVTREVALERFRELPGMALLDPLQLPTLRRVDLGPDVDQGVARLPAQTGEAYRSYVSALDATANEVAGIRVPDVSVPVATHTGWVPRHPDTGGDGELLDMMGTTLPLARTRAERQEWADPRLSIADLYRDREDYLARARAAAEDLVTAGYLLAEDVDLAVDLAVQRYDVLAPQPAASAR
ncbi:MAG: alpha/beta hydrolase domain-containing protein [Chloroflexota bacterium]